MISVGKKLMIHPIAVTLCFFQFLLWWTSTTEWKLVAIKRVSFKQRESDHVADSLEQLYSKEFIQTMAVGNIMIDCNKCIDSLKS